VYTPTQIINFTLVPPQFRFVFVGVVSLFWSTSFVSLWNDSLIAIDTYLSIVNSQLDRDIAEPVGY
jgi:protein Mpv17